MVFAKVNTDEQQELAGSFGIRSIPTLMVFREKVILFQQAGALPGNALEQVIAQAKALDMAKVHAGDRRPASERMDTNSAAATSAAMPTTAGSSRSTASRSPTTTTRSTWASARCA